MTTGNIYEFCIITSKIHFDGKESIIEKMIEEFRLEKLKFFLRFKNGKLNPIASTHEKKEGSGRSFSKFFG